MNATPTIKLSDLTDQGAQDAVLDLGGTPLAVRVRRRSTSGPERLAFRRLRAREELARAGLDVKRLAALGDAVDFQEAENAGLRYHAAEAEIGMAMDVRREILTHVESWLVSWGAVDPDGAPLPLEVDALFDTDIPTDLWDTILAAIVAKRVELFGDAEAGAAASGPRGKEAAGGTAKPKSPRRPRRSAAS